MHCITYCEYGSRPVLANFENYEDAKKAYDIVCKEYPDAQIYLNPVVPIGFAEFMDKFDGKIPSYERHKNRY